MKQKFIQALPWIIVIFSLAFWHLSLDCRVHYNTCKIGNILSDVTDWFMGAMYAYSLGFTIGAFLLVFQSREVFKKWLHFAAWWFPLAAVLIAITPWTSGQWLPLYFIGKGPLAIILGGIMSVVTIFIVLQGRGKRG